MIPDLSFMIRATNMSGAAFAGVQSDLRKTDGMMATVAQRATRMGRNMRNVGLGMSASITAPMMLMFRDSLRLFDIQAQAQAQVVAGVQSTSGAAGLAADEIFRMASEMQRLTRFGDEDILGNVSSQLLTFTNITGPEFERAQMAVLDMAARRGDSLLSTSTRLGKALQDPIKGLTALRLAGVDFTEEQKNMITSMVDMGDVTGAQGVILDELSRQYGGSAIAAVQAGTGFVDQAVNSWGDLKEVIGEALVPLIKPLAGIIWDIVDGFNALTPEQQKSIVKWGAIATVMGPVVAVAGLAVIGVGALGGALMTLGAIATGVLGPLGLLAVGVAAFGPDLVKGWQQAVDGIEMKTEGLLGQISGMGQIAKNMLDGNWAAAWEGAKDNMAGSANIIGNIVGSIGAGIGNMALGVLAVFQGDWNAALDYGGKVMGNLKQIVVDFIGDANFDAVTTMVGNLWAALVELKDKGLAAVEAFVTGITGWISDSWIGQTFGAVTGAIREAISAFTEFAGLSSPQITMPPVAPPGFLPYRDVTGGSQVPFDYSSILDGTRAAGGPVEAGGAYLVGEEGAEIFVAKQSGTIIPNSQLGSVQGMTRSVSAWFQAMFASIGPMTDANLGGIMRKFAEMSGSVVGTVGEMANSANQIFDSMGQTISANFFSWLQQGQITMNSFRSMLASTWDSISGSALSSALQPVQKGFGDAISGMLSGLFGGMGVGASPNANGAVVMGPAYFPSRGGMSSMSEAGPEAIMPLERGRDGRLGIRASGGSSGAPHVSFDVTINNAGPNTTVDIRPSRRQAALAARGFAGA